jgi:hypothetical protein
MTNALVTVKAWDGRTVSIGDRVTKAVSQVGNWADAGRVEAFVSANLWVIRWDNGLSSTWPASYLALGKN